MTLHERLTNWGRAYRVGKHKPQHCYSVEWRTQGWHSPPDTAQIEWLHQRRLISDAERSSMMADRPQAKPDPIDQRDAALVERAWATMESERHKFALKKHYVHRWTHLMLARKLREEDITDFFAICEHKFAKQIDLIAALYAQGIYPTIQITESASLLSDLRYAA